MRGIHGFLESPDVSDSLSLNVESHDGTSGRANKATWPIVASAIWLLAVAGMMAALAVYSNSPGPSGPPLRTWPAATQIVPDSKLPTLLVFLHPKCPCSRATVEELARLEATCGGQFRGQAWFLQPEREDVGWVKGDLWEKASALPGLTVHIDPGGTEARRFGAETSGETMLYDSAGQLLYKGGITLSRGHVGENPGEDRIAEALRTGTPSRGSAPAFGCPLFAEACAPGGAACSLPASGS